MSDTTDEEALEQDAVWLGFPSKAPLTYADHLAASKAHHREVGRLLRRWRTSLTRQIELLPHAQQAAQLAFDGGVLAAIVCLQNNGMDEAAALIAEATTASELTPDERARLLSRPRQPEPVA